MPLTEDPEDQRDRRPGLGLSLLNAIPNVFWSVVCIVPVYVFCARYVPLHLLYGFGGISVVPFILPASALERMAISVSPSLYRRLGVAFINRFAQDGVLVRRFATRFYPDRALLLDARDARTIARLRSRAFQRERFHLAGFVFFLLLTGRAALLGMPGWAVLLLTCNVVYNVYPVLLQQYVRLRLGRVARRQERA
ncbi:hypothetical protein BH10ACI4_BH10ACI4_24780 [soil metagenome]